MNAFSLIALMAIGLTLAIRGVKIWQERRRRARADHPPGNSPAEADGPPAAGASSVPPAAALKKLQARSPASALPRDYAEGFPERIDELIKEVTEAHAILARGGAGALSEAAKRVVRCRWLTGLEWRKYMAGSGFAREVSWAVCEALKKDLQPLVNEMARLVALEPPPALVERKGGYAFTCAACGENAVTFELETDGVKGDSISEVNHIEFWSGERGQRLAALLEAGDARAVIDYLTSPEGGRLAAYCSECGRVYCREHYTVSAEWSGTWYTAGYATCPLGHEREFE